MGTDSEGAAPLPPGVPPPLAAETVASQSPLRRWPDAARALADGRPAEAHAVLRRRLRESPPDAERRAILAALDDPRTFASPSKPPGLGRLNGVGTGMYGRAHEDPDDGSYVKTRWVSFAWIPVFPLDQWIVRDADGGGWYFDAKVPLDVGTRRIRAVVAAAGAVLAAVTAGALVWNARHVDLHVLNGLDVPAELAIGDAAPVTVGPGGRQMVRLAAGQTTFRCRVQGRLVDERTETVKGGIDLVAYNVAGSAPLYVEDVVYTAQAFREGAEPKAGVKLLAGTIVTFRDGVDDVFRESPDSVSMRSSEKTRTRRHADVLAGGWRTSLDVVAEEHGGRAAADLGEKLALAVPDDAAIVQRATELSSAHREPAAHAEFLRRLEALRTSGPR